MSPIPQTFTPSRSRLLRATAMIIPAALMVMASSSALAASKEAPIQASASYLGERIKVGIPADAFEREDGTEKVYKALSRKAMVACRKTIPGKVGRSVSQDRCMSRLMDGFIESVDHEGLTAHHAAKDA